MVARFPFVVLACLLGVAFSASSASAHALLLKVVIETNELRAEVKYDGADHDGGAVTVTLTNAETKEVIEEKPLDNEGKCRFARPANGKYLVVAKDQLGHRKEETITVTDANAVVENTRPRELMIVVGIVVIGVLTLMGWLWASRKTDSVQDRVPK